MSDAIQFAYSEMEPLLGAGTSLPYLPLRLTYGDNFADVSGLLDTGATVNVIPFDLGLQLGAVWEEQTASVQLTGNLAQVEARVLLVSAVVAQFPPVRLAFAWTQAEHLPLILGQVNFFLEFDVCFFRSRSVFEVKQKSA